ncbi:hypothetical protein POV27_12805 [Aureisphaera galaxeae]|uniref:hypothetical protein n=1 Tax=Aureisphaera galaxeae TaxID=1538023 RepID=UPI0023502924|nr:hypothetical protein [Aureisphaera galaxeae]MDC8004934.1 hypothetical protein [Aureisphaera galaxeae]
MRTTITLVLVALTLLGCNSVKRNQKFLAQGNYDQAIYLAVKKLRKGKVSSKSDAHIALLEEAFVKVVDDDTRRIKFLEKENQPSNSKEIFFRYLDLEERQNLLRPILPLTNSQGREAKFKIKDYSQDILVAKNNYVAYSYDEAAQYLNRNTTLDARTAYNIYCEIEELQENYKDVRRLKEQSRFLGTDFVHVELRNRSGQIIPRRLERELLDFNTYDLDDFWTQYHEEPKSDIDYQFGIRMNFEEIAISPERISEREFRRKKKIEDGWKYQLDRNGNVMKDSLGNDIKIPNYIYVTARVMYTTQTKSVLVGGDVHYRNLEQGRDMGRHPLATEFIFENEFAKFRGDERALTEEDLRFLEFDFIPFPSNEQMVLDAGDDIKARLRDILRQNSLR